MLFYERLFVTNPELRSMFNIDFSKQRRKLMKTLAFAVAGLTRNRKARPDLAESGSPTCGLRG